jgi:3-hydroxyacyl-CoA dehydrogenase
MSENRTVRVELIDGVAVLSIDNPPVNTITAALRGGLSAALDQVASMAGVRAMLLRCEGSTFCSGADIGEFSGPPKEAEYRALFARFEAAPVPVIVALHGTVLGGGLELALACHYRLAAPGTRLGFPEVTLGIIPGAGGTQRMPRLIGVEKTLELMINAKPIDANAALELGIIDQIIAGDLRAGALAYAAKLAAAGGGPRPTSARVVDPATATDPAIDKLTAQARTLYPNRQAALRAIEAVRASVRLPFDQGLMYENEIADQTKATVESHALIHVFFAERATRRVVGLPAGEARAIRSGGVVGAGTMGGGIAMCFANAGMPVTVIDTTQEALDRGLGVIDGNYASMVKRGRLTNEEHAGRMALIRGSLDYADLAGADVIIEAVYESMDLKKAIFGKLDQVAKPGALLASNTSTLDVAEIARATSRPGDVVGLHFFSPANVMPLLEVIRTDASSPAAIRTAIDLAKPLRKTPVLARVCYGFVGNRMMEGYAREAERMVLEGATPKQVDDALERWGMAMGILAVFDMAGVEVGVNIHKANAQHYPPDPTYYQADFALVEAGRLGQKNGKGYYRYEKGDRNRHQDPEAIAILRTRAQALNVPERTHTEAEIVDRCLFPLLNEGFRILQEGIVQRAADIDVVWTSGYGFPRYRGGPMFYAESIGLKALLEGMHRFRAEFGPMHWEPAALLVELVDKGMTLADWEKSKGDAK